MNNNKPEDVPSVFDDSRVVDIWFSKERGACEVAKRLGLDPQDDTKVVPL